MGAGLGQVRDDEMEEWAPRTDVEGQELVGGAGTEI